MKRLTAMLLLALPLLAEEPKATPAATAPATTPATTAPAADKPASGDPAVSVSGPTTRVSAAMASAITARLPKYAPPPPEPPKPPEPVIGPEGEEIDDPEDTATDRPKNKIIRLPAYIVQGERPPVFSERELYTRQSLAARAAKRYLNEFDRLGLNAVNLPIFGVTNEARAMQIYEEEERLRNINDLENDARDAQRAGDKKEADYIRKESNDMYLRSGGMDWNSWKKED